MLRRLPWLITCLAAASCTRDPQPVTPTSDAAPPPAKTATLDAPTAATPPADSPAESSLAIKRGIVTLAAGRTTYRPCDETADLWLLDQTDGVLRQAFPTAEATTFYVEAYGERTQAPPEVATARGYPGALILEEVLYAIELKDKPGCETEPPAYIVSAHGVEPAWSAEIREKEIMWHQTEAPKDILMQIPAAGDAEGTVSYRGVATGYELEMEIDGQPCRDIASGEYFAYSARATLNKKEFIGCARVGS